MQIKAYFLGYQECDDRDPIALFDVSGGERGGSSVGINTLKDLGIEVPPTPNYNEWAQDRSKIKNVPDHELNQKFIEAELAKNLSQLESAIAEIRSRRSIPYSRARMRMSQEKLYNYLRGAK